MSILSRVIGSVAKPGIGEVFFDPGTQFRTVTRAVVPIIEREQVKPVVGKQPSSNRIVAELVDIDHDVEHPVDEFVRLRP